MYDQMISAMNDGEYSSPIHSHSFSFYSVIRNTARLCSDRGIEEEETAEQTEHTIISELCRGMVLTKDQLLEIAANFEALASIAQKRNRKGTFTASGNRLPALYSPKNTFHSEAIELSDQMTDQDLTAKLMDLIHDPLRNQDSQHTQNRTIQNVQMMNGKKKKKREPVLEYIPKTMQSPSLWRNSLLFQHPLSTMSRFTMNGTDCSLDIQSSIEPLVLLGLHAQSEHSKLRLGRSYDFPF